MLEQFRNYHATFYLTTSFLKLNTHYFNGRMPAPLLIIGRAVICNRESVVENLRKLNIKGHCG